MVKQLPLCADCGSECEVYTDGKCECCEVWRCARDFARHVGDLENCQQCGRDIWTELEDVAEVDGVEVCEDCAGKMILNKRVA